MWRQHRKCTYVLIDRGPSYTASLSASLSATAQNEGRVARIPQCSMTPPLLVVIGQILVDGQLGIGTRNVVGF